MIKIEKGHYQEIYKDYTIHVWACHDGVNGTTKHPSHWNGRVEGFNGNCAGAASRQKAITFMKIMVNKKIKSIELN